MQTPHIRAEFLGKTLTQRVRGALNELYNELFVSAG